MVGRLAECAGGAKVGADLPGGIGSADDPLAAQRRCIHRLGDGQVLRHVDGGAGGDGPVVGLLLGDEHDVVEQVVLGSAAYDS